jgi:hypothetical protein
LPEVFELALFGRIGGMSSHIIGVDDVVKKVKKK